MTSTADSLTLQVLLCNDYKYVGSFLASFPGLLTSQQRLSLAVLQVTSDGVGLETRLRIYRPH